MKKRKYTAPDFLISRLCEEDVISTSGNQGSGNYPTDNNWDSDIGEWDTEM